jgi:hypothetical protein
MSTKPLRTASKVPGGAVTARGSTVHLTLPGSLAASISHHSIWVVVRVWAGGTHDDSVSTVWAATGAQRPAAPATAASAEQRLTKVGNRDM